MFKGDYKVGKSIRQPHHDPKPWLQFLRLANVHLQVAVEDRPYPNLQKPTDAILKVSSTALCGSDLHFYRGHLKCPPDFICGHEFVGEIVEKGDAVKKFNIGDKVGEAVKKRVMARSPWKSDTRRAARRKYWRNSLLTVCKRSWCLSTQPVENASIASVGKHLAARKVKFSWVPEKVTPETDMPR